MADKDASNSPPNAAATRNSSSGMNLSCRECQRKKIKCDKTYPCGPCTRASLPCRSSTRKPRAKTSNKAADAELRQRIAKLEKLVETFQGEDGKLPSLSDHPRQSISWESGRGATPPAISAALASDHGDSPSSVVDAASPNTNKYVAGGFWSSLTSEVKALADVFEEDAPSDDEGATSEATPPYGVPLNNSTTAHYELMFCPPGALYIMPGAMKEPDPKLALDLVDAYLTFVEPMSKIFHVPTLTAFLHNGHPYLRRAPDALCNKALRASIYYAGANALTDEECESRYGRSRDDLILETRKMVDLALWQADPMSSTEIATLQALVVYVASYRVMDQSRRAWAMVGLLVRLARAIGVHREVVGESVYIAELKRRLWYNIVFLDCYSLVDRGSEPAIHPDTYTRLFPSHVNDEDFDLTTTVLVPREKEITDMSFPLIAMEGSDLTIRMAASEATSSDLSWQTRLEQAYAFQKRVHEKYLVHCKPDVLFHKIIAGSGQAACHSMILRAVRPMQHHPSRPPPRVDSPWVMQLALNILHHSNGLSESISGRWRRMPWVPWHAMSVTLAGLCSIRDTEMANEAWALVEISMSRYASNIADTTGGMLWKPLEKLRIRAAAFRDGLNPTSIAPTAPPVVQPAVSAPAHNGSLWSNIPVPASDPNNLNNIGAMPMSSEMSLDPLVTPLADGVFDFPPEMTAALPNDSSWLDWEAIIQDMDVTGSDDMQWM